MCGRKFFFIVPVIILLCYVPRQVAAQASQDKIDSLLAELPAAENDTNKVLLLCEISRAYFQLAPDKGVVYGHHALKLADELEYERGIMKANNAIGRCHAVQHALPLALKHFSDALAVARKLDSKTDIGNCLLSIGNVYSEKEEFDKALTFYLEAKTAYKIAGVRNRHMIMNSIGSCYVRRNEYRKAIPYLEEAIRMEEADKANPGPLTATYLNMGAAYIALLRYDSSLHYLQKALRNTEITGNKMSAANALCNISVAYLNLAVGTFKNVPDSLKNKRRNLENCIRYSNEARYLSYEVDLPDVRKDVLFNLSEAHRELGDYKEAYRTIAHHHQLKDSLHATDQERAFAQAEAEFNVRKTTDSLKYENLLKDKELKKRRGDRNKIIAIISLLGISSLLFINRQKLRHQQKRKEAEFEKQLAEEFASQQLRDFTRNMQEKNDMIDVISAEIAVLREKGNNAGMSLDESLLSELRQSILLTDAQWDTFKASFEKVHSGYLSRLRTKLPGLTPAETRFIVLSRLKLSAREMAGMLGITPPAVRANKYRLMKKLGFEEDHQLDDLIQRV